VRFMDKSNPLEEEGREPDEAALAVPDDERDSNGGGLLGLIGVSGEGSNGDVRSSDGEDVVLVLVLAVAAGVGTSDITQPDGGATCPSTTRLRALLGRCGPLGPLFGHPNQLLRRAAGLGVGATSAVPSSVVGVGSGAVMGGASAMASKQTTVIAREQIEEQRQRAAESRIAPRYKKGRTKSTHFSPSCLATQRLLGSRRRWQRDLRVKAGEGETGHGHVMVVQGPKWRQGPNAEILAWQN
jgi:hypothetical protein